MTVLIVDDSKGMRLLVTRALRQAGYGHHTFREATNGAEALQIIRTSPPDLVLSDWNMPEMNGIDCLKALRAEGNQIRFGFVTSEAGEDMRAQAVEAGALFLVTKPFSPEAFQQALGAILG